MHARINHCSGVRGHRSPSREKHHKTTHRLFSRVAQMQKVCGNSLLKPVCMNKCSVRVQCTYSASSFPNLWFRPASAPCSVGVALTHRRVASPLSCSEPANAVLICGKACGYRRECPSFRCISRPYVRIQRTLPTVNRPHLTSYVRPSLIHKNAPIQT